MFYYAIKAAHRYDERTEKLQDLNTNLKSKTPDYSKMNKHGDL